MTARVARRDRWIYFSVGAFLGFVLASVAAFEVLDAMGSLRVPTVLGVGTAGGVVVGLLAAWLGEDLFEYLGELGR